VQSAGFEVPPDEALDDFYYESVRLDIPDLGGEIPGWRIMSGCIDIVNDPTTAAEGHRLVDLNGSDSTCGDLVGQPSTITQQLPTQPGQAYRVTFSLAGYPNGDPPVKTLDVGFGGATQTFTIDNTGQTSDQLGWVTRTFTATATSTTTELRFTSTTPGDKGRSSTASSSSSTSPASRCGSGSWSPS